MTLLRCLLVACVWFQGGELDGLFAQSVTDPSLAADARKALASSTDFLSSIATEGGYLWRYSADLKERSGEGKATATQIWVQPPGTPSVGMAFLEAYAATMDPRHLDAAQRAAQALVRGQLQSGGWAYMVEFDPQARHGHMYRVDPKTPRANRVNNVTVFDDDNTQSALRFLMSFLKLATNRPPATLQPVQSALEYGLQKLLEAQYPNGAWPQRYNGGARDPAKYPVIRAQLPATPERTFTKVDYSRFYTLNDHTQRDCIRTLLQAWEHFGETRYLEAAKRGGNFLVLAQLPDPQAAWAQQYNFAMEPSWARSFEPPAVSASESSGAVLTLLELYLKTGERDFLKPIPAFVDWARRSEIRTGRWARLYELQTNKPIYGDRDGKIHYSLEEISGERQTGYSWEGEYGIPGLIKRYEEVAKQGRDELLASQGRTTRKPAKDKVTALIKQQDAQGRWLTKGALEMRVFVQNMQVLADFLRE